MFQLVKMGVMENMKLENPDIKKCIFSASITQLVTAICLFISGCVALGYGYAAGTDAQFPITAGAGLWCSLFVSKLKLLF